MEKTIEELQNRYHELQSELRNINNAAEAENRTELTADEEKRFNTLTAEAKAIKRQLQVAAMSNDNELSAQHLRGIAEMTQELRLTTARAKAGAALRSYFTSSAKENKCTIELRDAGVTAAADVAGVVPMTIGDIVEPLEKGMILSLVGAKMLTGLSGDYKYPVIPYVEATIEEENVSVADTSFKISALTPNPKRLAISVPLSNWAIAQSDFVLYNAVVKALTQAVSRTLNRWMFQPSAVVSNVYGPLAYNATANAINIKSLSASPTYKELQEMISAVESTGAYNDGTFAFVMSAKMAAILRATPIANGDKMILEDNTIGGFPVYFTEEIESLGDGTYNTTPKNIGFGRWSDCQVGQFGSLSLVIDPYSRAKENVTELTVNANFSEDVIRKGSFVIGTIA